MSSKERNIEEKLLCLRRKHWALIIFVLQALILIIMLAYYGTPNWIQQGSGPTQWKGGLLQVTDGPSEWVNVEYKDMQSSCANLAVPCTVFQRLKDAGSTFCFFDVIAYASTVVWMTKLAFTIMQRPFLEKINAVVWPSVGLFCHILAEIIWSGVTQAKFSGSCSDVTSSNLCSTDGPAAVLTVTVFYIVAFALFLLFHIKRFSGYKGENIEKNEGN